MKIAIYTLGCKVNQYETQAMEQILRSRGHELVAFESPADAYIVNTCTVTAVSDKKSRQAIRRAQRLNPDAITAVCGCYAQTQPEPVKALGVDLVYGTGDRIAFLDLLEQAVKSRQTVQVDNIMTLRPFDFLPAGGMEGRTRAMLKVEDGCVNFCTYCAIPYARGPVRSLPAEKAVEEALRLEAEGFREIVLTGIEISSWGRDLPGKPSLACLVEEICRAVPRLRIRLGSLEPRTVTEEFCRRTSALSNLCPHFHLSLQSGCDETLKRMNRKYDSARFLNSCRLLRASFPACAVTTDLIVGFPGETDAEFDETLSTIREANFSAMHIFPYSRRTGTPAAEMPHQIPNAVKEQRAHTAARIAAEMEAAWLDSFADTVLPVLFEEEKEGLWRGYAPNYAEVRVKGDRLHNVLARVKITGRENGFLTGTVLARETDTGI